MEVFLGFNKKSKMKKIIFVIGLLTFGVTGWSQDVWLNLGTSFNGTKSFDMFCGITDTKKIGGYFTIGIAEGDYELTGVDDYTDYITINEANSWGDPVVGYGTKTGLFILGGGVLVGIHNHDEKISEDWLMVGLEGGNDGPIYQIRYDPTYILGNGNYALVDETKEPTRVFNLRCQYIKEYKNVLLGCGGLIGTHPGVTFNLGVRIQ
jgi:hypothetical protein